MADTPKRNRFDLAATLAAKAAGKAAGAEMDDRLVPINKVLVNIDKNIADLGRRFSEDEGPTLTLDELTQIAREEMKSASTGSGSGTDVST